jgi:hypothetical protein
MIYLLAALVCIGLVNTVLFAVLIRDVRRAHRAITDLRRAGGVAS